MRHADLDLYDASCEVLAAAQALRRSAGERTGEAALAPTLGCLHAALRELELAVEALGRRLPAGDPAARHHVRGALDDVVATLRLADRAAEAARAVAAQGAGCRVSGRRRTARR